MARTAARKKKTLGKSGHWEKQNRPAAIKSVAIGRLASVMFDAMHIDWTGISSTGPVYAVGDVHGMADLLDDLLLAIEYDAASLGVPAHVVFLGDAVDRGPDSRKVIDRLMRGPRRYGDEWLVLRGNHEQALLDGLNSDEDFEKLLLKGGVQTLLSYGLARKDMTRKMARAMIPAEHLAFLETLPLTCRTKRYLFVHAGVRPGRSLDEQAPSELMSLREPFFSAAAKLPWIVIHGHTPSSGAPVVTEGRICVDTGACMTGILTAAVIEAGKEPRFLVAKSRT